MDETQSNRELLAGLDARVSVLEAANRRLRAIVSALVLLAAAVVTAGATVLVPDTLAARSFRLVDGSGAERAALTAGERGTALLTLIGSDGRRALTMTIAPASPFLIATDAEGRTIKTPAGETPTQPTADPAKRSGLNWGKPRPSGGKEEDDSFDWAD